MMLSKFLNISLYRLLIVLIVGALTLVACTDDIDTQPEKPAEDEPTPEPEPEFDPEIERGWYDAPYIRYEADALSCVGNCQFLPASECISDVQSEASFDTAAQLIAKGDYVEWMCQEAAEGVVIRFSLPDSSDGLGTKGDVMLSVDGKDVATITLDSYHAWQYKERQIGEGNWYFDNTPAPSKYARMRFDEKRVLLAEKIPAGKSFRLTKLSDNTEPYTIDFVELEPVPAPITYESILDGTNVRYNPEKDGALKDFIIVNAGRTIFIPPGVYEVDDKIWLTQPNTRIVGAGVWHTEIYFTADPSNPTTYANRGFRNEEQDYCSIENLYIGTSNERRYFDYQGGVPMGKGAEGKWGRGSSLKNVWIEHFECGAWISYAEQMIISECRMRNNYADGLNISGISSSNIVERSNFRNNGDDNLASWSSLMEDPASEITFRHCTSELGWRAGGVGIFGGKGHKLHNLLIQDQAESGLRLVTDFAGAGFSEEETITIERVTIMRCGAPSGEIGEYGTIGGAAAASLDLSSCSFYDLHHIYLRDINIIDSQYNAIAFDSDNNRTMHDIRLENIVVDGWKNYGIEFNDAAGEVEYHNLIFIGDGEQFGAIPENFEFIEY